MKIETMHAYTHAQNGASNKVLEKCGMQFVENYPDNENVIWNWWKLHKSQY
jgi:[ribosomal protein S5]-alanine N-acetyltransferase